MQIHHLGFVVSDATNSLLVDEGLELITCMDDPIQTAKIGLYKNPENEWIELIQPLNEKSPVWKFLQQYGNSFHHECYQSTRDEMEKYTTTHQLVKVMGPVPAIIFNNRQVVFYLDKNQVVEFILSDL